jgi:hypothetical protein
MDTVEKLKVLEIMREARTTELNKIKEAIDKALKITEKISETSIEMIEGSSSFAMDVMDEQLKYEGCREIIILQQLITAKDDMCGAWQVNHTPKESFDKQLKSINKTYDDFSAAITMQLLNSVTQRQVLNNIDTVLRKKYHIDDDDKKGKGDGNK